MNFIEEGRYKCCDVKVINIEKHLNTKKHIKNVNDIQKTYCCFKNVGEVLDDTKMNTDDKIKSILELQKMFQF
jgi:hypothetical protein